MGSAGAFQARLPAPGQSSISVNEKASTDEKAPASEGASRAPPLSRVVRETERERGRGLPTPTPAALQDVSAVTAVSAAAAATTMSIDYRSEERGCS